MWSLQRFAQREQDLLFILTNLPSMEMGFTMDFLLYLQLENYSLLEIS